MQNFERDLKLLEDDLASNLRNWNTKNTIERVQIKIDEGLIEFSQKERGLKIIKSFEKIPFDNSFPGGSAVM